MRYSVTTFDPGARELLTQASVERPFSTAFLASRPAATSTDGFDVFVQLVMAAMTTLPCRRFLAYPLELAVAGLVPLLGLINDGKAFRNDSPAWESTTRSCGRLGPARLDSTVARSSARCSEYSACGVFSLWNMPCSRQ